MPYPRFTKVIIDHFISKDNTISMRNKINLHIVRDDSLLGTLKFVSKTKDCQKYRALVPDGMINLDNTALDVNKIASLMSTSTVPPPPPPLNPSSHLIITPQQQALDYTTTTTNPTMSLLEIPNFIKPLLLIKDQGRQVVPVEYFINNDLEYLKGGSSSSKYATSTTRTKAAKYENIEGIEDMILTLQSPVKFYDGTHSSVRTVLHDFAFNLEMNYLPKRHWSNLEKKRSRVMIKAIDKLLFKKEVDDEFGKVCWWERVRE
nr:hypothetical protein [Tanacetum cinerariifolium]